MTDTAIATMIEYDELGRSTAKPVRLQIRLCSGAEPQAFEITLPDKGSRHRSITIRRSAIERVLSDNPTPAK